MFFHQKILIPFVIALLFISLTSLSNYYSAEAIQLKNDDMKQINQALIIDLIYPERIDIYFKNGILNAPLDLDSVRIYSEYLNKSADENNVYSLYFIDIAGFYARTCSPLLLSTFMSKHIAIEIIFSNVKFSFFDEHKQLVQMDSVDNVLLNYYESNNKNNLLNLNKQSSVLELIDNLKGLFSIQAYKFYFCNDVQFKQPISPLLFKDCSIDQLVLFSFTNTTIRRHYWHLTALNSNEEEKISLNSRIYKLDIVLIYNLIIDDKMLSRNVFMKTNVFSFSGSSYMFVGENLFKPFNYISYLQLSLPFIREFWHSSSDNKWLSSLNACYHINLSNESSLTKEDLDYIYNNKLLIKFYLAKLDYNFPDEDICLFRHFNKSQLQFMLIYESENLMKRLSIDTCLKFHLFSNYVLLYNIGLVNRYDIININITFVDEIYQRCSADIIEAMLQNCDLNGFKEFKKVDYFDMLFDFNHLLNWIELIGPIITFPIVSFIGIITNLLVIITIKAKRNKSLFYDSDEKRRMFNYLVINSAFNITECAISSLTLLNECLGMGSIFCSSI